LLDSLLQEFSDLISRGEIVILGDEGGPGGRKEGLVCHIETVHGSGGRAWGPQGY